MSDLHVLVIPSWYPTKHGILRGIFFREQAIALREEGVKIGVVYPDFRSLREISATALLENYFQSTMQLDHGVPTYRVSVWNIPIKKVKQRVFVVLANYMLKKYIHEFGMPDVLHAQSALYGGLAAKFVGSELGIPYVVTEHSSSVCTGLFEDWQPSVISNVYENAASVVSVSGYLAGKMRSYYSSGSIEIVPNYIDSDFFCEPPLERVMTPYRFLSIGWLNGKKGMELLIRAFSAAFASNRNILLEIGGDGPERLALEKLVAELGIKNSVIFLGSLDREQVRDAMWRASAYVSASQLETFGVTIIEALSTGLPVIATRSGGPEDIISSQVGMLVENKNVDALAYGLSYIFNHRNGFFGKQKEIRDYSVRKFGKSIVSKKMIKIFIDAISCSSSV